MKINSISYSANQIKIRNNQNPHQTVIANSAPATLKMAEIPYYAMLANSAINFNGLSKLLPKTTTSKDLAEIVNCFYCDEPMILSKKFFKIVWPSPEEPTNIYNKKLIGILEPLKEKMHDEEFAVFETIKKLNSLYPDKTFQELLSLVRRENLEKLQAAEIKILKKIRHATKKLPIKFSNPIKELLIDNQSKIMLDEKTNPFRRKVFIDQLGNILKNLPDQDKAQTIIDKAYHLQTSKDDRSAFIVKYASKVQKQNGKWAYRSSEEISQHLLCSARSTLDHLAERHPQNPLKAKGETKANNLVYACEHCNDNLKENTELPRFAKRYPNIHANMQKQINTLVLETNKGTIINGAPYIEGIAQTLDRLSTKETDLRVDISKLNPSPELSQVG